ncbi:MAG: hypothetical protein ABJI96_01600 [Paracoccaceae bacterium]
MNYPSLQDFLANGKQALVSGPVAIVLIEDDVEIATTLRHHLDAGFKHILALMQDRFVLPDHLAKSVHRITYDTLADAAMENAVNQIIAAAPGTWLYYCFNAEYLFYPFCETRTVSEMLAFHAEERRDAMLTYVIDLYAPDLGSHPNAVTLNDAHLDRSGYYALKRDGRSSDGLHKDRQLSFYGGLRWRFEEHIPLAGRKIDRVALFKAKPGLKLRSDHTFNDDEYNTYACPWHNNLTSTICSFRVAKALKRNPGSKFAIDSFYWHNSTRFEWNSKQLLDLGLMEPGQWF